MGQSIINELVYLYCCATSQDDVAKSESRLSSMTKDGVDKVALLGDLRHFDENNPDHAVTLSQVSDAAWASIVMRIFRMTSRIKPE